MNSINALNATSTNITTSAYVTICASTPFAFSQIWVTDTTGKIIKLAVGGAGSEEDIIQLPVSSSGLIKMPNPNSIPVGSRLSVKAIDANATSGFSVVTLLE